MEQVKGYYKNFVKEGFDEKGILNKFEIDCPDNFNFGYDMIDKYAQIDPDRPALIHVDLQGNETRISFKELSEMSTQAANLFASKGIKKDDKVMLVLKRNYQFWVAIIALFKLGAIAIPANHLLTTHDYTYRFSKASVVALIGTNDNPDIQMYVEKAEKEMNINLTKFITNGEHDGWINFDEELKKQPTTMERVPTNCREHMLLYFTSGTTGYPKMVIHTHRYALWHLLTAAHWQNVDPNGIHFTISDSGWGKCVWGKLFGQLGVGACVFIYDFDKFVPADVLKVMQDYKITSFCAPPTMYRFFIKQGIGDYDLSNLKYSCVAGEALNPEVFNKWYEFTGLKLMEGFGQTESVPICANLIGMTPKPGSMGKPTPLYNVVIVDDEGNPVPKGETGEICIKSERGGDGLFDCYYRDPELTDEVWHDGLYHTCDTAWEDEDGYLWYVGRNDDVIKASGYRIGPFEIESVLIKHAAVLECAVTGAPHPVRGQVVKATIVLTKDYQPSEELKAELQEYVKKNTAPYKYPRIIEFVDQLPKTISGKIIRAQIRKQDIEKARLESKN